MGERRCDCCDLPVSMCGREAERRQRAERAARRARLLALPGVIPARYAGVCPYEDKGEPCGERFAEGDPITRVGDGTYGEWASGMCCLTEDEFAARAAANAR